MSESKSGISPENEAKLEQHRALAEGSSLVKNKLLSIEQTQYCMGWKSIVNPNSAPLTAVYNAMGPDISTALLTTNATELFGIDIFPPDPVTLGTYLDNWDVVDTDTPLLPPVRMLNISKEAPKTPTDTTTSLLEQSLARREANGYWDIEALEQWSIERCIAIELKKLGVSKESITVDSTSKQADISFLWGFPGEDPKPRRVLFAAKSLTEFAQQVASGTLPSVDVLYEKSMQRKRSDAVPNDLVVSRDIIRPGGFVLLGRGHSEKGRNAQEEKHNKKALGEDFSPILIPNAYQSLMERKYKSRVHQNRYGWELYGSVKNQKN